MRKDSPHSEPAGNPTDSNKPGTALVLAPCAISAFPKSPAWSDVHLETELAPEHALGASPFYEPFSFNIGGQWSRQGAAFSKAAEAQRTAASPKCGPTICNPTGNPFLVHPAGTDAAG